MVRNSMLKSILAGIMIGISCTIYLSVENKVIGALLFSFGLLIILFFNFRLYTGIIGYANKQKHILSYLPYFYTWMGNFMGASIYSACIVYCRPEIIYKANEIIHTKFQYDCIQLFILSLFCGMLMFIAVDNYMKSDSPLQMVLGVFLCISAFIISGFEHSIADIVYCVMGSLTESDWSASAILISVVTIGNSVGAILTRLLIENASKDRSKLYIKK